MAAPSLATKNQTSISIGLINWYCYLPNIKYNGTWATNYPEAHDPRTLELASQAGVVYLMDAAAKAAVQAINKRADILPYTTVNIKRFTDCGEWWPTVDRDFAGLTSGYAMSAMGINDIGEKHKDVIGVMGQQYSSVAKGTAEVLADYKIPYCAIASAAPSLSNKDKFPYFFRLISSSGLGNYLNLLLQGWKVKRMAILSQSDDLMSSGFTSDISKSMKANGIEVVATINLKGRLTHDMVLYAKTALLRSEARYIYISGQADFVSKLFFSLAIEEMVGYKYVYIAMNTPSIITSDISLLSPKLAVVNHNLTLMTPMTQGFVSVVSYSELNMNSSWMQPFYDEWNKTTRIDPEILDGYWMNSAANLTMYWPVTRAFDCVMMLLLGFDKLMKQNPKYTPQELSTRALSKSLNYSQFLHLNYDALTTYPLALNPSGDYTTAFYFASYNGTTFPGASNASGNPFVQIPFAGTDVDGTILAFYNDSFPVFYGGSNIAPPDGPPIPIITFWSNSLGSSNGQGILALLITGLLISGSTLAFFVNFREAKQLKMTSVPECIVTIIGSAFCYISLAFYLNSSSTTKCVARIWLVMMGYAFMMIPVIMKNVRLYIILKSKKRLDAAQLTMINRIVISIGILIQLALLGYWASSTKNTPQSITVGTDSFNVCNSLNIGGNRSIQILTAYSVLIHVLLAVMAFMLTDVDPMFNESPALSSIFALVGLLVGVMNILPSNPSPKVDLIECVCIWLSVTITLVLLFASKMYDVLFEQIAEKGLFGLVHQIEF
ncbi:periplasmic binding protein-like I [Obelidium mucronatum]|nr:periplasmic binding protein-like I [Obelidium mucronatum]